MSLLVNVKTKFEPDGVELGNFSMKGLDDLFFTSGNSLEAISLERESTVLKIIFHISGRSLF